MDDSDIEIFWGPVSKHELEIVKQTLPGIPVRPSTVLQSPDPSKNVPIKEDLNSQFEKESLNVAPNKEKLLTLKGGTCVCEIRALETCLSVPENDYSEGQKVKASQVCAENQSNDLLNSTSEGEFLGYKTNKIGSSTSIEMITLDSPVKRSEPPVSDKTEIGQFSKSPRLSEKSNDSLQKSIQLNSSYSMKQDSDIVVVCDDSVVSELSTTFGSVGEDVDSLGNEAYVTCHTIVGELAQQYSSLSIKSDNSLKESNGSEQPEQIEDTNKLSSADYEVDLNTEEDGLFSHYSNSQETSTCISSTIPSQESSFHSERTYNTSPNSKSSVVCNESQNHSQSAAVSNIHSDLEYVERWNCLSAESAVEDSANSTVASHISPVDFSKNLSPVSESCSANKSELSSDIRDINNSALLSMKLNLSKRFSKKNSRYSAYEREKFFGKIRNEMGKEIEKETDSILWNSSDDSSNSVDLNDTLEEVDMMMKRGLQYMRSKDDSSLGNHSIDELHVFQDTEPQGSMESEGKRIPFRSKVHCIQSQAQEKCFNGTELKNLLIKNDAGNQFRHHKLKVPKQVGEAVFKTPAKKKPNNFLYIKSPVAAYIKSHPVPLVVTVKSASASASASAKCNGRNENVHLKKLTSNVSPIHNTPVRNMAPLPVIKYESAPVINMMQTRSGEKCFSSKSSSDTPKVMKHTGRAVLGTSSTNKLLTMKESEVSMVFDKSVSQTNTL